MYIILRVFLNKLQQPETFQVVKTTKKYISSAMQLLKEAAYETVTELCGIETPREIITIDNFKQIIEPPIDTAVIYQLSSNPHQLHIYRRKTEILSGWIYTSTNVSFRRVCMIVLVDIPSQENTELIQTNHTKNVPNYLDSLINEMKSSKKFLSQADKCK
jgi:hypothetical protein